MPLKHSQVDALGVVRWNIGSVIRNVKCMPLSFKLRPGTHKDQPRPAGPRSKRPTQVDRDEGDPLRIIHPKLNESN